MGNREPSNRIIQRVNKLMIERASLMDCIGWAENEYNILAEQYNNGIINRAINKEQDKLKRTIARAESRISRIEREIQFIRSRYNFGC